ncbi:MAG: SPOR domain-containing protein [Bacteroidota bacterium]
MRAFVVISLFLMAVPAVAQRNKNYQEDLSAIRPRFEPSKDSLYNNGTGQVQKPDLPATRTVNTKVDAVLDSLNKLNVLRKFVDGFTIQIYSGQNREEANNTKKKMTEEFADMKADLQYLQPKFRVKTGNYFTRLEAQKDLLRLKRGFPNAILVPERIPIK